jgi:NADH dehydrogenase FAD-containing subunit
VPVLCTDAGAQTASLTGGRSRTSALLLPAWLTWAFVHLQFLATSSLRLSVFLHWVWTYFTGPERSELIVNHHGQ